MASAGVDMTSNPYETSDACIGSSVPFPVRECVGYLTQPQILKSEGLFRICGAQTRIAQYAVALEQGRAGVLRRCIEPEVITGLLKFTLLERELPLGRDGSKLLEMTVVMGAKSGMSTAECIKATRDVIAMQPVEHQQTLHALIDLMDRVVAEDANRMSFEALGTALGPTIFPSVSIRNSPKLLEFLCCYQDEVWSTDMGMRVDDQAAADGEQQMNPEPQEPAPTAGTVRMF